MHKEGTLFDAALHANWVLHTAGEAGVPRSELAGSVELPPEGYADPMQPVPYTVVAGLLAAAVGRTGRADFALHMGQYAPPEMMGLLGYFLVNQPSLRDILTFSYDLLGRISNVFRMELLLERDPARLALHPTDPDAPMLAHMAEFHCAVFMSNTRMHIDARFAPRAVAFAHPAPPDVSAHRRLFGCPVTFAAPVTTIAFDPAWLERRVPRADPRLHQTLAPYAVQDLERLPRSGALSERLRVEVRQRMGQAPLTLPHVAGALRLKSRTLQYRLRTEGTTFQRIVDAVRKDLACEALLDGATVDAVSARLGFADTAVFHRAFRRWTGTTPQAFRAAAQARTE